MTGEPTAEPTAEPTPGAMPDPMIEVRDLSIGWSRDEVLLEHASFEVRRGEIFGILGRSAVGKSTLFRVLIGLEQPLSGEVTIAGLGAPRLAAERPAFGVMFQQGALISSLTVGENVALPLAHWTDLPRDAIRALVYAKLQLVGMEDAEHLLPAELSGGMRKRAAIARALALEPALVFLDEPSSGLDPVTSAELDHLIVTLARTLGLTVVVVTHELGSILAIVDRCILLDRTTRTILAEGPPGELVASQIPHVRHFFARVPEAV
jgi:phospholipid/cholesterol/gamma-HCH transport system ATP-binding protein